VGFGDGFAQGDFIQHSYHWRDVLTRIRGAHSLKFGYEGWHGDDLALFAGAYGIPNLSYNNMIDLINDIAGMTNSAGSLALADNRPTRDAFLVSRLRAAGAVILGRTNLSEWANFRSTHSLSGWSGRGGQCRNPYATDRTPSGSSSGSAVAVSANLCAIAVGTETDGSIVSPASINGAGSPDSGLPEREGTTLKAIVQDVYGPADVLELRDIDRPTPGADEVLIKAVGKDEIDAIVKTYGRISAPMRVLLVDDSQSLLKIMRKVLANSIFHLDIEAEHEPGVALARRLRGVDEGGIESALRAYEQVRQAPSAYVQRKTRSIGQAAQATNPFARALRDVIAKSVPRRVRLRQFRKIWRTE